MLNISEIKTPENRDALKEYPIFIVTGIVFVLLPICFYVLLFRDPLTTLDSVSPEALSAQERAIQEKTESLLQLQRLQSDFRSLDQNIAKKISDAVPGSQELPELITNMHTLVKAVNGRIDSFAVSDVKPTGKETSPTKTISVQVVASDISYESLKSFIVKILRNSRFLSITSMQYDPKESSASFALVAHYVSP